MRSASLVLVVMLLWTVGTVQAEWITIAITAQVTTFNDPYGVLGSNINNIITGTYTYDVATPDSDPATGYGKYWNYNSPAGIRLKMGELIFQTNPNNCNFYVEINSDTGWYDGYLIRSSNNLSLPGDIPVHNISWQLDDPSGTALSSDAIPLTAPDLTKWQSIFGLNIGSEKGRENWFGINARVTSAILVPEPCSGLILLAGLALLRRRKTN